MVLEKGNSNATFFKVNCEQDSIFSMWTPNSSPRTWNQIIVVRSFGFSGFELCFLWLLEMYAIYAYTY